MTKPKIILWTCTDPDSNQYGRRIKEGVYEFKEFDRINYSQESEHYDSTKDFIEAVWDNDEFWITDIVDISKVSELEIYDKAGAYYTRQQIDRMLTGGEDEDEWILMECIFEQNSGMY